MPKITPDSFTPSDRQMFEKFHIDDAYDIDTKEFVGFICTGVDGRGPCGMRYPSLEDRMLREPDECSGCRVRAAHG